LERVKSFNFSNLNSKILIIIGWAFEFFEFLMKKYNFTYNIVMSDYNIVGGSNDSEGSLMQMMLKNVIKLDVKAFYLFFQSNDFNFCLES
jgi:CTP:phosphocholine cytidylyltransferase-like protein